MPTTELPSGDVLRVRATEDLKLDGGTWHLAVDEKSTGALPHTVLIAPGGKVLYSRFGPCEPLEIGKAIVGYLGRTCK